VTSDGMSTVSIDPTIKLSPSKSLVKFLQQQQLDSPPERVRSLLEGEEEELTVEDVRWIKWAVPHIPPALLLSSSLRLPSPQFADRNPELEARCQKLRAEQENRDYRAITNNVRRDREVEEEPVKKQLKELNNFLLLIVQFVVSVVCSFMFGFLGPYYLYGKTDLGARLLAGIICAFIVGCADMYFVIRQMLEEDGILLSKKYD